MGDLVLDASAALPWCFADETTPASYALLERLAGGETAEVPAIWALEIANVLAAAERRKKLTAADVAEAVALYAPLSIHVDDETARRAMSEVLILARGERLSSYDAAYLELAMRLRLPLATRDNALKTGARRIGVRLIAC
jgi:predicted nucleic acid-binding protein